MIQSTRADDGSLEELADLSMAVSGPPFLRGSLSAYPPLRSVANPTEGPGRAGPITAHESGSPQSGPSLGNGIPLKLSLAVVLSSVLSAGTRVLGLPSSEGWTVIGGTAIVAALILVWILFRLRHRAPTEDLFDSSGRPVK